MSHEASLRPVTPVHAMDRTDPRSDSGRPRAITRRSSRIVRRAALFAVCTIGLSGCMSAEEQRKADLGRCSGYGYAPGSEGFAACMMDIDQNRERIRAERSLQLQADLAAQNRQREAQADLYRSLSQQRIGDKSLPVCGAASGGGLDGRTGYWYGKDCRSR